MARARDQSGVVHVSSSAGNPSGTNAIHKIYAESFRGEQHLHRILEDAQSLVDAALATSVSYATRDSVEPA